MLPKLLLSALAGLCVCATLSASPSHYIRLNTIGYEPEAHKQASVVGPVRAYSVVRVSDGKTVFQGAETRHMENSDTQETLAILDFSAVRDEGVYRLEIPGVGKSAPFRVAKDVYRDAFVTVTRAMYLWRCGTAVHGTHNGVNFDLEACHLKDGYLDYITGKHEHKDTTGGWHDAGDYNKYVVNAGVTVGCMLRAWEDYGSRFSDIGLNIPESGGKLPDFLAELRYEMDWLFKMAFEDGSVSHKVTTLRFGGFVMPADEKEERFLVPWSSAATANFVAMMAQASRAFRPYDAVYADRCLEAAWKSYAFLKANPQEHHADMKAFRTGEYKTADKDDRLWAAAELWETTGDAAVLADVEARLRELPMEAEVLWDWAEIKNLGYFTYVLSQREGRDASLVAAVGKAIVDSAEAIVAKRNVHGYARTIGEAYFWGCNGTVARVALNLSVANRLQPKADYLATLRDGLHHLFGRNVHGRSYVTGLGFNPPNQPHDRRLNGDKIHVAWPGYLVGGANPGAVHWFDVISSYRTNEIAINWNGALIYALAAALPEKDSR